MTRLVVVGNGMVGSRFVEEVLALDAHERFEITVLGAEPYAPYNRVLLSEVVAGRVDLLGLELAHEVGRARIHTGTEAVAIDRGQRLVRSETAIYPYDVLVLATGASARIPQAPGLDGTLPAGVHPLRTLDDAREIVATTANASRSVVIGGGVLGVEVACGLAGRGLAVTLVHGGAGVMDRQLAPGSGQVAEATLAQLGVDCWTSARTVGVRAREGRVASVAVEGCPPGGTAGDAAAADLGADLVVLATGTTPACSAAAAAGLATARGIRVDADLATSDPAIFAIGDCAEPPEGATGLVAQGWEQARRLAIALTGPDRGEQADDRERPSLAVRLGSVRATRGLRPAARAAVPGTDVVKVKARGLDIVAMGVCGSGSAAPEHRVLRLDDAASGRHVEVVVAQGQLVGATCVGSPDLAADLVATYTRRTPVPSDPSMLFLRPVQPPTAVATGPEQMPARATVCSCNSVTKGEIVDCIHAGSRTVADVARATRATTGCGSCTATVCGLLDWLGSDDKEATDVTVG